MTAQTNNNESRARSRGKVVTAKLRQGSVRAVAWLGSPIVRVGVILVSLGITGYLLVSNAWGPLKEQRPLPPGISSRDPAIEIPRLNEINDLRLDRITPRARRFTNTTIFARPSPPQ